MINDPGGAKVSGYRILASVLQTYTTAGAGPNSTEIIGTRLLRYSFPVLILKLYNYIPVLMLLLKTPPIYFNPTFPSL